MEKGEPVGAAAAWSDYVRQRERPVLHFDRNIWPVMIRREFPQLEQPIIDVADRFVRHEIFGAVVQLPVKDGIPDWLSNPTRDSDYIEAMGTPFPLTALGRAYLLTGDEKYAEAFVWYFESWFDHRQEIDANRGNIGVAPLYRAYYPAVRARLLLDNYYCLAKSPSFKPALHMKLMRELLGAARWVHARNEEFQMGNQQVAAVLGPAAVGLFFPEFRQSAEWVARATQRMAEHLENDLFPDGGHRELCDQYHVTVLRDIGYIGLAQAHNGQEGLFNG